MIKKPLAAHLNAFASSAAIRLCQLSTFFARSNALKNRKFFARIIRSQFNGRMAKRRRRFGGSRRRTRRRLLFRRSRYRNARIRRIARLANERKFAYYDGLFPTVSTAGTLVALQLAQGDDINTRDGNRVLLTGIRIRSNFVAGDIAAPSNGNNVRFMVIKSEAPIVIANMPSVLAQFRHNWQPRKHRILMDKTLHLPTHDVNGVSAGVPFYFKRSFKLRLYAKYTGTAASQQSSGFLYVYMVSDSTIAVHPICTTDIAVSFKDY